MAHQRSIRRLRRERRGRRELRFACVDGVIDQARHKLRAFGNVVPGNRAVNSDSILARRALQDREVELSDVDVRTLAVGSARDVTDSERIATDFFDQDDVARLCEHIARTNRVVTFEGGVIEASQSVLLRIHEKVRADAVDGRRFQFRSALDSKS